MIKGNVMSRRVYRAAVTSMMLLGGTAIATAQETGLAESLHQLRAESGRTCMSEHFHYGSSSGQANRKAAEAEAIKSWASFTEFEYGRSWADFRIAGSRGMSCSQSGGGWGCNVEARPCKRATGRKR